MGVETRGREIRHLARGLGADAVMQGCAGTQLRVGWGLGGGDVGFGGDGVVEIEVV